jgi:hypothetical protein
MYALESENVSSNEDESAGELGASEHPSMLTSMANLAFTYRNQGRWKEAEQLEVQVMETLHWLEALGWMRRVSEGILAISSLESIALVSLVQHVTNMQLTYRADG